MKGVKVLEVLKICVIRISYGKFFYETVFYSFHLLYTLLVQNNFNSNERILIIIVVSGHGKHHHR